MFDKCFTLRPLNILFTGNLAFIQNDYERLFISNLLRAATNASGLILYHYYFDLLDKYYIGTCIL